MDPRRAWILWGSLGVAAVLLVVAVARTGREPARRPAPGDDGGGLGREPTISLYDVRARQRRRLPLEEYVAGVVAGEMKKDWPVPALAAQAIIARTFTLQKMQEGGSRYGTDVSTDVAEFQAYAPESVTPNVREAVRRTRGLVVTYGGRYIRAYFHSCAGGITATAAEGLEFTREPTPYVKVVRDPPCADPSVQSWEARLSRAEVEAALRQLGAPAGDLSGAAVVSRGPSGRATRLRIGAAVVSAPSFRMAVGPERMRSTLIESVRWEDNTLLLRGRGFGHGVGMSQWGALEKARRGWRAEDIIRYYFQGVRIERRWR